jgi:glycosyltransferase involved in cell wall biosynthesis
MDYSKKIVVSIGLSTFNRAVLLKRAIESIVSQSFSNFDLIVIDDGSTEDIKAVTDSFCDERIKYIRNENNLGLMASRNRALMESCGEYVAFQDSDDYWHEDFLKESVDLLEGTSDKIGAVYSRTQKKYFSGKVETIPNKKLNGNLLKPFLKGDVMVTMQSALIKRACLDIVGNFDEDFKVFGDAEFMMRFAEHFEFLLNPKTRVFLEVQEHSISRNKKDRLEGRRLLYEKHISTIEQYPSLNASLALRLAKAFHAIGNFESSDHYIEIAKNGPWFGIEKWRALVLVLKQKSVRKT